MSRTTPGAPPRGELTVICGCMFSGKTARLITRLEAAQASGRCVAAIKHALDARYEAAHLATHDGRSFPATTMDVLTLDAVAAGVELLGIDEIQFFGPACVPVIEAIRGRGCSVIVAGIDHDAWGQPFSPLPRLKERATRVELLRVPCGQCGRPARFTQRVTPVVGDDMVGGLDQYKPRCARCFVPLPLPAPVYEAGGAISDPRSAPGLQSGR